MHPGLLAPGLGLVIIGTAAAALIAQTVSSLSTLVAAVFVGAVLGNLGAVTASTAPGLQFAAKSLLRVGVVLLGLRLSLGDIAGLGVSLLAIVGATVVATFFGTQWLGRRLGLSEDLSLLVATGFSICGASAIAAMEGSTDAEEEEVAAAIGLVTVFGSLAIVVLPLLASPLGLEPDMFGIWVGASVHDVAQVVATASVHGASVGAIAIAVKLTRVTLLAPIVTATNLRNRKASSSNRQSLLPAFVVGFLTLVAFRTVGIVPDSTIAQVQTVEGWLFAAALVGLGSGVRLRRLRKLGLRPLLLGSMAWIVVAGVSYLGIVLVMPR